MENKMSAKIKWAIALLIVRVVGTVIFSIATIGNLGRLLNVEFDSLSGYYVFAFLYEQLPTIAAVILIFYNHKQPKAENTGFTLMQKWIFALAWGQQGYSLLSFALLGIFGQIVWSWLGSCAWLALITWLLSSAWKNPVIVEKENTQETPNSVPPVPYTKTEQPKTKEDEEYEKEYHEVRNGLIIFVFGCSVFV